MNSAEQLSPRQALDLANRTDAEARSQLRARMKSVWIVWAVAWTISMGAGYLATSDSFLPTGLGFAIYGLSLGLGGAYTGVTMSKAYRGIGGDYSLKGRNWLISWAVGWIGYGFILRLVAELTSGSDGEVSDLLAPILATMLVGLLYQQGGAYWPRSSMNLVGWLLIAAGCGASLVSAPYHYLALLIGGVISFVVGGVTTTERPDTAVSRAA